MSRTKNVMDLWRCPACGNEQEVLALEVAHRCPNRVVQAAPAKGKKKLPEIVRYEKMTQNTPPLASTSIAPKTKNNCTARSPGVKAPRQTNYLRMVIKPVGEK